MSGKFFIQLSYSISTFKVQHKCIGRLSIITTSNFEYQILFVSGGHHLIEMNEARIELPNNCRCMHYIIFLSFTWKTRENLRTYKALYYDQRPVASCNYCLLCLHVIAVVARICQHTMLQYYVTIEQQKSCKVMHERFVQKVVITKSAISSVSKKKPRNMPKLYVQSN